MDNKYPDIPGMNPERQKKLDATIAAANQAVADLPAKIAETQRSAMEVLAKTDDSFAEIDEVNGNDESVK